MAISAQDKILYVANKLGLSTLKNMQGSTGAVYDVDTDGAGIIFGNASKHSQPGVTNINDNKFEVNEALLIETIAFFTKDTQNAFRNFQISWGSSKVIVFDLVIGNKRVMKDTPVFAFGNPYTFANVGNYPANVVGNDIIALAPRHQVYMEGAGILIPPQVEWYVDYRIFDVVTGAQETLDETKALGCYLFGTSVLLNFNTSI